jgi:HSP20 family protein
MNKLIPISRFSLSNPLVGNLDTLLDSFFNTPLRAVQRTDDSYYSIPRANVSKGTEGYMIQLAAPGYSREDFNINVENNDLTISCSGESHSGISGDNSYTTQEYSLASFSRSWSMPKESSSDSITARYDAGILTVSIPVNTTVTKVLTVSVD